MQGNLLKQLVHEVIYCLRSNCQVFSLHECNATNALFCSLKLHPVLIGLLPGQRAGHSSSTCNGGPQGQLEQIRRWRVPRLFILQSSHLPPPNTIHVGACRSFGSQPSQSR